MQFNTSVSIMPPKARELLEPGAAELSERLEAVRRCQERGVLASSALVQPIILPCVTDEAVEALLADLRDAGIVNWKPELLTVSMENLAIIGQVLGHQDKDMERRLYEIYIAPENMDHKKQRERTAPNRRASTSTFERLVVTARGFGISTSICAWVRKELNISEELIPIVNRNGYQCLGYQTRLLEG
jgi:DNA repair photolyase